MNLLWVTSRWKLEDLYTRYIALSIPENESHPAICERGIMTWVHQTEKHLSSYLILTNLSCLILPNMAIKLCSGVKANWRASFLITKKCSKLEIPISVYLWNLKLYKRLALGQSHDFDLISGVSVDNQLPFKFYSFTLIVICSFKFLSFWIIFIVLVAKKYS